MELQTELHHLQHNALEAQIQSQSSDAEAKEQAEQVVMEYARKILRALTWT
jgi:diaminopimelate decarboxylase